MFGNQQIVCFLALMEAASSQRSEEIQLTAGTMPVKMPDDSL